MNVIIVEDEKFARENLEQLLTELAPEINIEAYFDTVHDTVEWLRNKQTDLIFLDIHLADDLSFKIFEQVNVKTPVIFTTAYDQYALKAFKINSVDYLLKPIDKEELSVAIDQFKEQRQEQSIDFSKLQNILKERTEKVYQRRFLVKRRDKIMSIKTSDIAYFEGEDRYVYLVKNDGSRYIVDYKLSQLEEELDPAVFFRLNRSFIAHFDAIDKIVTLSKSRVKVYLAPLPDREVIISTHNTRNFKMWLNS